MDDDHATGVLGHKLNHLRVGEPGNVVYDRSTHAHGGLRDLDMARVYRHDGPLGGERPNDRQHAASLLVGIHRAKTGTRRLPTHIDDVGSGIEHGQAVRDGRIGIEVLAPVAKRIGRDVEHAHDARSVERKGVFSATPDFGVVRHVGPFASAPRSPPHRSIQS